MKTKKTLKSCLAMLLAVVLMLSAVGCVKDDTTDNTEKTYTYNTYLMLSPSNWNELTYQDANDTEILSYISDSFFGYDFKYDENGEIIPGEFVVTYEAATKLEDVTAQYAEAWGLPEGGKGYAYKITLREDLKWNDGTAIKAEDFVYSMSEQLNPLFQNYRADSYYVGSTVLVNAENYVKQGQYSYFLMVPNYADEEYIAVSDMTTNENGGLAVDGQGDIWFVTTDGGNWGSNGLAKYQEYGYFDDKGNQLWNDVILPAADENGYVAVTQEVIDALCHLVAVLHGYADAEAYAADAGEYAYLEWQEFCYYGRDLPTMDFSEVGIFVGDTEYEIVVVLQNALDLLDEDGNLTYKAAYNFSSLPLVKKDLYESCKIEPTAGTSLWTTNYNTSVDTTASWGPYMLESFQTGTQFVLAKNENWYGYGVEENAGLYQTTSIVCDIVKDWNSAWLMFQAGEVDGISIDVSIADDYKGSDRAYFTPSDFVSSLQLQSDVEQLKAREEDGINKSILGYTDFRKALSLSINRTEFTTQCTTSSKAGYGLFNSMHYYDVANGGVFRNTDEARQVLCDVYGVDASQYASLEEAEASITGYNLDLARSLLTSAYNEALANGDIKETDIVKLTFGTGSITEATTRQYSYIASAWKTLAEGTPLEGRIEMEIKDFADTWTNDFRSGAYDVCMGGWTGAAWDPGYFLLAYLDSGYMYSAAWDTANTMMTFTMKGVGENGEDITETMGLLDWYDCLNGSGKYDWSSNGLEESQRLQLIAALEKEVLSVYYTVPLANSFSASMLSYQVDYVTYEYNTFMGYGGVKYMTYNYDDAAWAAEVAAQNGELNYK